MDMDEVSFVLTVGQACSWVSSCSFGRLSDWLIQSVQLKRVNARRFIHSLGQWLAGSDITKQILTPSFSLEISEQL